MNKDCGNVCYCTTLVRTDGFPDSLPDPMATEGSVCVAK